MVDMDDKKTKEVKEKKESKELAELKKRNEELEDQLKRAIADYRNLEKRVEEEKKEFIKFANKELLLRIFPAFDTLLRAEKHIEDRGLKLSIKKLNEVLKDVGAERIETVGHDFDPNLMECVDTTIGEENKVIEEITPGFTLHGKVIRPAQVKVGKKEEEMDKKAESLAKEAEQKGDYM